jgi:predicted permease
MRRSLARLGAFLRRGRAERDMAREMAAHLALMEDDFRRRGVSDDEARLAARRAWGGRAQSEELHRDARSFVWLEQLLQDVRHAGRSLRKSPGFVTVALLSLAFGIGVNTAIFALVNGILLKHLPVPQPERVVQVLAHVRNTDTQVFSYPSFVEMRRQTGIFSSAIAFSSTGMMVDFGTGAQQVEFSAVSGGYFPFLGGRPTLGRLLDEEDDRVEGASPVCVISYRAWQSHYGGDPGVLNRTLRVGLTRLRIVGVASRDFVGADIQRRDEVWVPTADSAGVGPESRTTPSFFWLRILARLQPGVSLASANQRLRAAGPVIDAALPKGSGNQAARYWAADGSRGFGHWRSSLRDPLVILMGAVTLVLLVACANLANLLLARSGERRQEFAIKLSLGISRARLVRQLLIETFAIALAGGALGWALSTALTGYLLDLFSSGQLYRRLHVSSDRSVLLYTFAGCLLTALAAGVYPAWQAARTDLAPGLASAVTARRALLRRGLILVQVTLAVVLLFGATLFGHSLRRLKTMDLGYDIDHVLSFGVSSAIPGRHMEPPTAPPDLGAALARVRALPGVESAALSNPVPLSGWMITGDLKLPDAKGGERTVEDVYQMTVGLGLFAVMRMPLLKGRDFGSGDRAGAPLVAVVNQRLASLAWPGDDPIGKRFPLSRDEQVEVIGVAGNIKYLDVREEARPILYLSFDQMPGWAGTFEIRCRRDPGAIERDVRQIVRSAAPQFEVRDVMPLELWRDGNISQDRLLAFLSSLFGGLGTAIALVGIYGLISYAVTRRTREVGIRMSVGAQRGDVLWLFLRESVALVAAGMAIGLPLALGLARLAGKLLFGITAKEPVDVAITLVTLAAGGVAAGYLPGRRATRVDPMQALRHD